MVNHFSLWGISIQTSDYKEKKIFCGRGGGEAAEEHVKNACVSSGIGMAGPSLRAYTLEFPCHGGTRVSTFTIFYSCCKIWGAANAAFFMVTQMYMLAQQFRLRVIIWNLAHLSARPTPCNAERMELKCLFHTLSSVHNVEGSLASQYWTLDKLSVSWKSKTKQNVHLHLL